ncbi:MAG TPA: hypothetical protein VMH04_17775 [Candidatus Solibacter sp.]|nr:hypothetical protein [Candidatus Solibacter sp.]
MTIPERQIQVPQRTITAVDDLRPIHVTIVCYAVLGLSATVFGAAMTFTKGQEQAGWAFFLFAWLVLPVIAAFVTCIINTVKARHHRLVLALCIIHILFVGAIVLAMWRQSGPGASETPVDIAIMSYGVFFTAVAIWWFATGKRRMAITQSTSR